MRSYKDRALATLASENEAGQSRAEPRDGMVVNFMCQLGRAWHPDVCLGKYICEGVFEMQLTFNQWTWSVCPP